MVEGCDEGSAPTARSGGGGSCATIYICRRAGGGMEYSMAADAIYTIPYHPTLEHKGSSRRPHISSPLSSPPPPNPPPYSVRARRLKTCAATGRVSPLHSAALLPPCSSKPPPYLVRAV